MTIFDYFQINRPSTATTARGARQARRRVLGSHFELLESRCLLSIAPPAGNIIAPENTHSANFYISALVPRDVAASSGSALAPITGPSNLPGLLSGGLNLVAPLPNQQFQPLLSQDKPGGLAIVDGMIDIGALSSNNAQAVPMTFSGAAAAETETFAVRDMLSSLKYVPMADQADEHSQQPTYTPFNLSIPPTSLSSPPSSSLSTPPTSLSNQPASFSELSSSSTIEPSSPSTPSSSPSDSPSNTGSPLPSSAAAPLSGDGNASGSSTAPTSTSPDAPDRQLTQQASEGGMVSLVRQPVVQASTVDRLSVAAIDALLEVPAKVDGAHGRFQAFEISVNSQRSLPVAPLPAEVPIIVPFGAANHETPTATDPNLHSTWGPSGPAGAIPPFARPSEDFFSAAFLTAAAPLAGDRSPLVEVPHGAIDAAFGELSSDVTDESFTSSPQLDLATATLLAALIGRALWPARIRKAAEKEKAPNAAEASIPPVRLGLDPIVPS